MAVVELDEDEDKYTKNSNIETDKHLIRSSNKTVI